MNSSASPEWIRAATALRLGASTLLKSQTYLGAQYLRLRSKLGAPKAITAMAHRLARLVYRSLKYGQHYIDKGAEYYERRNPPATNRVPQEKGRTTRPAGHTGPSLIKKFLESVYLARVSFLGDWVPAPASLLAVPACLDLPAVSL